MHAFQDKICLVTGAAAGIGLAIATQLLSEGARVAFMDLDKSGLDKASQDLACYGERMLFIHGDVSKAEDVARAVQQTYAFGGLDILINNAGICRGMRYEETTLTQWRQMIDTNLMGVVHGIHYALPILIKQGGGQIVNVASISGLVPTPIEAMYTATKFAVVGLSEAIRFELERYHIDVSVVCPADVETDIFNKAIVVNGQLLNNVKDAIPFKRISAQEAAATILTGMRERAPIILVGQAAVNFLKNYRKEPKEDSDAFMRIVTKERLAMLERIGALNG